MPYELLEALWCERYHCLPSQVQAEDASRLLLHGTLLTLWRACKKQQGGGQLTAAENRIMGHTLMWEAQNGH